MRSCTYALACLAIFSGDLHAQQCPSNIKVFASVTGLVSETPVNITGETTLVSRTGAGTGIDRNSVTIYTDRRVLVGGEDVLYKYFWVYQDSPCEPDINSIELIGAGRVGPDDDGLRYVSVMRPEAVWSNLSEVPISVDDFGARHLSRLTYRDRLSDPRQGSWGTFYDNGEPDLAPLAIVPIVRIGLRGDLGDVDAGGVVRTQSKRVLQRVDVEDCLGNGATCFGEITDTGNIEIANWDIRGPIGELHAGSFGDTANPSDKGNAQPSEHFALNHYGRYFDPTDTLLEDANDPQGRQFEVKLISTRDFPQGQTGNIEFAKPANIYHGSIRSLDAVGRVHGYLNVNLGRIEYVQADMGIGPNIREAEASNQARLIAGYGGTSIIAGIIDPGTRASVAPGDANLTALYYAHVNQNGLELGQAQPWADRTNPDTGRGVYLDTNDGIYKVRSLTTNVILPARGYSGRDGGLTRFRVVRAPDPVTGEVRGGTFEGQLQFRALLNDPVQSDPNLNVPEDRVWIEGDCFAYINFVLEGLVSEDDSDPLTPTLIEGGLAGLRADKAVWIGGKWDYSPTILLAGLDCGFGVDAFTLEETPNGSLYGQIIVNQRGNAAEGPGATDYLEQMSFAPGNTIYSDAEEEYPSTAERLGGGALGVAPFRLNATDSVPPLRRVNTLFPDDYIAGLTTVLSRGKFKLFEDEDDQLITACQLRDHLLGQCADFVLAHYGPVQWAQGTQPLTFSVRLPGTAVAQEVNIPTSDWSATLYNPGASAHNRDIRVNADSLVNGLPNCLLARLSSEIVIRPTADLRSRDVQGNPAVYWSEVVLAANRCSWADMAGDGQTIGPDGVLAADDIIVFINGFVGGSLCIADVAGAGQTIGPDGFLTADDTITFVAEFFNGCGAGAQPPCAPCNAIMGRSSMPHTYVGTTNLGGTVSSYQEAQRLAQFDALIAAESDPARRAMLQAARALMLQGQAPAGAVDDR